MAAEQTPQDGPSKAYFRQVYMTKELALEWLATRSDERNVSHTHVEKLCRDMELGGWEMDTAPIQVAVGGQLINGQHRLAAIVRTGIPQWLWVQFDVSTAARPKIDTDARVRNWTDGASQGALSKLGSGRSAIGYTPMAVASAAV